MNRLLKLVCTAAAISIASLAIGQGIYFDPAPTDVTVPAILYIDITSSDCNCPELLDADPETNPLYIWAWNPNEARADVNGLQVTNGTWNESNENLKLKRDESNPNIWYFDFVGVSMVEFYGVAAAVFYESGIDFLIKEKNGAANSSGAEQKSPDMNIIPEPIGCFDKVCPFPTVFFQDEYFIITYDNNKETNPALQNLDPEGCLIWYRYRVNGGSLIQFQEPTDKFKMKYDGEGIFSITMVPEIYFNINPGDQLTQIDVYITKPPINAPPFTTPVSLIPGCP